MTNVKCTSGLRSVFSVATVGAVAAGLLYFHNPHQKSLVPCPMLELTGCYCPLCGGLRFTYDFMHGNWGALVEDNAALCVIYPLFFFVGLGLIWQRLSRYVWHLPKHPVKDHSVQSARECDRKALVYQQYWQFMVYHRWIGVVGLVVWCIIRNGPWYPYQPYSKVEDHLSLLGFMHKVVSFL